MATIVPKLTLTSSDALIDALNFTVSDSLSSLGPVLQKSVVTSVTSTIFLAKGDYTTSYVFLHNKSTDAAEIITIEEANPVDATCDYNNDPTITMDSTALLRFGMTVTGTGIPADSTVASITNTTTFELSASTTTGAVTNGSLTFGTDKYLTLGAGEFAWLPWASEVNLFADSASGTPTLEVMLFQALA